MMKLGDKDTSIALFMRRLHAQNERRCLRAAAYKGNSKQVIASPIAFTPRVHAVALRIYQYMVELNELPSWRIPESFIRLRSVSPKKWRCMSGRRTSPYLSSKK